MSTQQTYRVVAYRIDTGVADGIIGERLTLRNAEAVSDFAVARRGVDTHFFKVEPEDQPTQDAPNE